MKNQNWKVIEGLTRIERIENEDRTEGALTFVTTQAQPCGCTVTGNGTLTHPLAVKPCETHRASMMKEPNRAPAIPSDLLTLCEALKADPTNPFLAGRIANMARVRYGMNYKETADYVEAVTGIDLHQWEGLMQEADGQQEPPVCP